MLRANPDKIPERVLNTSQSKKEAEALMEIKAHEEEMRNNILRTYISVIANQ